MQEGRKILQYSCFTRLLLPQNYFSCKKNEKNRLIHCQISFPFETTRNIKNGNSGFLATLRLNQSAADSREPI